MRILLTFIYFLLDIIKRILFLYTINKINHEEVNFVDFFVNCQKNMFR